MLTHLCVRNFTLVDSLDIEFTSGMTVITGETGAGKSILLDALGCTLGDRAESGLVRHGEARAEVSAEFQIEHNHEAQAFLAEEALDSDGQCLLRRVLQADGGSRAWINGQPVTLSQLRTLAEILVNIHGQHEHQLLLKKESHRQLLDDYGHLQTLCDRVKQAWEIWHRCQKQVLHLRSNATETRDRIDLLRFQIDELHTLNLQPNEFEALEAEQKTLANGESILRDIQQICQELDENETFNVRQSLRRAIGMLSNLPNSERGIQESTDMLNSALIQIDETVSALHKTAQSITLSPERLAEVETRLGAAFDLARKHRTTPNELPARLDELQQELESIGGENALHYWEEQEAAARNAFLELSSELTQERKSQAEKLSAAINARFQQLGMTGAKLTVELQSIPIDTARFGMELIEFLIQTNAGQPFKPLAKIASGGELSRISLAIQVETAHTSNTPTLVFDEVDVGIGGPTAAIVGKLLRELSSKTQVICVTHLPQVASQAHQQLLAVKQSDSRSTTTQIYRLNESARVDEIARMLGGLNITEQTRKHAKEMLLGS